MSDTFSKWQEEMIETAEEIGSTENQNVSTDGVNSRTGKNTSIHFPFAFFKEFIGYWDWPPSKQSTDKTKDMIKEGKSPQQIWDVHSAAILQNHKAQKEYHEKVLSDYENSQQNGNTIEFWEKYWTETYNTKLPNPSEMENRWKDWSGKGHSKDKFWEEERKRFKKENGFDFWKKWKAECKGLKQSHETSTCRWRRGRDEWERIHGHTHCLGRRRPEDDERHLYKMFDF